jgi:hypothetical protein
MTFAPRMNYISHYFLDAQPDRPYFNFGLALPDMMGTAARGWKPAPVHVGPAPEIHGEIAAGVSAHLTADRIFHNADFFKAGCSDLRVLFEQEGLVMPGIRMFFLVHIFLEMMLDRIIIRNRPDIGEAFYKDIGKIDEIVAMDFIRADGTDAVERFPLFFNRFREHKYVLSYTLDQSLFFATNRILNRTGQPAFPDESMSKFARVADRAEAMLTPITFPFFEFMRNEKGSQ